MPKVISRSVVVTDQDNEAAQQRVHVYYCLCKKLVLASNVDIDSLKKRAVDKARFLPGGIQYKLSSRPGPTVCLKRPGGKERQHRSLCPNCGLFIAYKPKKDAADIYLVDGAFMRQDEESDVQRADAGGVNNVRREETGAKSKYGSVSVATTTEEEELEIESHELGANYDANASVINMLLNRGANSNKRTSTSAGMDPAAKRKRGTLLN